MGYAVAKNLTYNCFVSVAVRSPSASALAGSGLSWLKARCLLLPERRAQGREYRLAEVENQASLPSSRQGRTWASLPWILPQGARFSKGRAPMRKVCSQREDDGMASFSTSAGLANL